jgi:hypothetical protein
MPWPARDERERLEIEGFLRHYTRLPDRRTLQVIERREKPDYFVEDRNSGDRFGVELTSVYLSDRSVPEEHIPPIPEHLRTVGIPRDEEELSRYKKRLLEAVSAKAEKARNEYDLRHPLILSVYVNEYRAIFLDTEAHWRNFVIENEGAFDACGPISEVVFWGLANDMVFSVRPESGV